MTTGFVGAITTGTMTYTATTDVKLLLSGSGIGTIRVNGIDIAGSSTSSSVSATLYVGAGQTVTLGSNNTSLVVSALEAN